MGAHAILLLFGLVAGFSSTALTHAQAVSPFTVRVSVLAMATAESQDQSLQRRVKSVIARELRSIPDVSVSFDASEPSATYDLLVMASEFSVGYAVAFVISEIVRDTTGAESFLMTQAGHRKGPVSDLGELLADVVATFDQDILEPQR